MLRQYRMFIAMLLAAFTLFSVAPSAFANQADQRIALKGSAAYSKVKGTAKYRNRGGEREFQVELENAKVLAGATLNVFVGSAKVGTMKVSALGIARLNRNSTRGQAVPAIRSGSLVQIKTAGGALVATGRFP